MTPRNDTNNVFLARRIESSLIFRVNNPKKSQPLDNFLPLVAKRIKLSTWEVAGKSHKQLLICKPYWKKTQTLPVDFFPHKHH